MLTSKQRAFLRSLANDIDTIVMVGKGGISQQIVKQADDALTARELIKGKVLETAGVDAREIAEQIAAQTQCDVVQVIGSKFVLFRRNPKAPKIELPKARRK
ncbi:MAG: ribosome assembly RNA-binding protein YhbY [Acutalibacteraceae bacterium]